MGDRQSLKGLFAAAALAAAGAADAEARKVTMPPELAPHVPSDLRSYFLAFLVTPPEPKDLSADLFQRHQAYMRSQVERGTYRLMGPLIDAGRIRGIVIVDAADAEAARALVAADPAVQAEVFAVEVHGAVLPNLGGLTIAYPPKPE